MRGLGSLRKDLRRKGVRAWVYAARVGELIKIGWTKTLNGRVTTLKSGLRESRYRKILGAREVSSALIFAKMRGTLEDEQEVQLHFEDHLHHGREWFEPHPSIFRYIKKHFEPVTILSPPPRKQIVPPSQPPALRMVHQWVKTRRSRPKTRMVDIAYPTLMKIIRGETKPSVNVILFFKRYANIGIEAWRLP